MLIPIDAPAAEDDEQEEFLTNDTVNRLKPAFDQLKEEILLKVYMDQGRDSREMESFLGEVARLGRKIRMHFYSREEGYTEKEYPSVYICQKDGSETGAVYCQIPQGPQFVQFVEDLYQASRPSRPLSSYVDVQSLWS